MKICFITPYPLRSISGVTRIVTDLCKGLKERGIDHLVISGRLEDEIEKDKSIEAMEINVLRYTNFKDIVVALKTVFYLFKHRRDFDLLHLHSPHLQPMMSAIFGKILKKPVITTFHGKFPKPKNVIRSLFFWITIKGTIAFSDKITFVDETAKKYYKVQSGEVIENGIDTGFFSPNPKIRKKMRTKLGLSQNDIVLLYVGRLAANKGIYDLLKAFSEVRAKSSDKLKLMYVGSGEIETLLKRIKSIGLENDVLVFRATNEIKPYYCTSDVFVLYSGFEGLSIALLEASSCGLVTISTKMGGIPNFIKDGENGLLLDYGDRKGLIYKIKRAVEDEKLRSYLGNNARERVLKNYSIEKTIDNYVNLYNILLQYKK